VRQKGETVMENYPDKDWLEKYEQIKGKLKPHSKLD
jgi:hypothetical protein